jgi:leucyl aminopeptidase
MKIKSINKKQVKDAVNVIVLAEKKSEINFLPCDKVIPFMKKGFAKEDLQSVKTPKYNMYVVNVSKADLEKIRKQAYNIHSALKDRVEEITVVGVDDEKLLAFAEAIYLSDYQFLKYFKNKDQKKNKLRSVKIAGVSQKKIDEIKV